MIYLAPLQGSTDFVYRRVYDRIFGGVDAFFTPYISLKKNAILPKYEKEVLPENNPQRKVVPQVLSKDGAEMSILCHYLKEKGFSEINLNLGCPYPMVTRRGKGSGLLPHPEKIHEILTAAFEGKELLFSVKLRAGLDSPEEIKQVIPVLNEFPLTEVILHPRIAKQLYKGDLNDEAFAYAAENLKHSIAFNGDIFSLTDFMQRKEQFPAIENWMLGRGILMNPFLPAEIKGQQFSEIEKHKKLVQFHKAMLETYSDVMDNSGNTLNKMQQFWSYFCYNFSNPAKAFKAVKKSKNLSAYTAVVNQIMV